MRFLEAEVTTFCRSAGAAVWARPRPEPAGKRPPGASINASSFLVSPSLGRGQAHQIAGGEDQVKKDLHGQNQDDGGQQDADLLALQAPAGDGPELGPDGGAEEQGQAESSRSTVLFTQACCKVTLAEVSTIWNRSVPMAAMVGMPMM